MSKELIKRIISSIIIILIAFFFIIEGSIFYNFFLIIIFLIISYEWYKMQKNNIFFYAGILFLTLSFYTAYLLRGDTFFDLLGFLLVILICISTDIGGYVFGKIFKGPKLTKISPNKTYTGVIGSYFFL